MTRIKANPKGELLLPKELMEAHGFAEGAEVAVSGGRREIVLTLVEPASKGEQRRLTKAEFIARIPKIESSGEVTDALIREAIDQEAIRKWDEENSR